MATRTWALIISVAMCVGTMALGQQPAPLRLDLRTTVDGNKIEFGRIGAIVADGAGRIYVADVHRTAQQVVVLNADGTRLRTLGGRGQGPGQFINLLPTLGWMGDTLLALNATGSERRVVLFGQDGGVVGTHARLVEAVSANEPVMRTRPVRMFTGGPAAFLLETDAPWMGVMSPDRPLIFPPLHPHYFRFGGDGSTRPIGTLIDSLPGMGLGLGAPIYCRSQDRKAFQSFPPPFSDRGPLRAFLSPRHLAKARQHSYQIDVIDIESGEMIRSIRRSTARVPLRDEDWNALPEILEIRGAEQEVGGNRPYELMGAPGTPCPIYGMRPQFLPVLRTIIADEAGRLWVESTSRDGFSLALFDAAGRLLGETIMPDRDPRVTPYARGNTLYIVTTDDLGVQGIRVYNVRLGR